MVKEAGGKTEVKEEEPPEKKTEEVQHTKLYKSLLKIVDKSRLSEENLERRLYSHDVAPLPKMMEMGFKMVPDIVVRPSNAMDVSKVVKLAIKEQLPVVPRGNACWALGGAVPVMGGMLLDMTAMNDIHNTDEENLTVTVGPGITWAKLYDTMMKKGYLIGAYPSSAPAATIGGWINTGGVGIGSYKYGGVENQILSVEMVLPTGDIVVFGPTLIKSGSLVDNLRLFIAGAEGTLGIITKVTLRMHPAPEEIRPISYVFPGLKEMSDAIFEITRSPITPLHISFLDKNHFDYLRLIGGDVPQIHAALNFALEGTKVLLEGEEAILDNIMKKHKGKKQSKEFSDHEWEMRLFEMKVKRLGPTAILSEGLFPVSKLFETIQQTEKMIKKMGFAAGITGTVPDRNTVAFMPYVLTDERKFKSLTSMAFTKKIGDLSFKLGGRPPGLGIFFAGNLKKLHPQGADVMRDIKSVMDPYDIMNPGKTTEALTRFGIPIPAFGMSMGMDMMALMARMPGMKLKLKLEQQAE